MAAKKNIKKSDAIDSLKSVVEEIANASVKLPANSDVFKRLTYATTSVVRASTSSWQVAYEDAKDEEIQDRTGLIEIYETIEMDTHASAITETICNNISQREFQIVNDGVIKDEQTELFKKSWFSDFLSIVLDTTYWGYSAVQLGDVVDDSFSWVKSIPRQNIIPEKNLFKPDYINDTDTIDLNKEPYKTWVISLFPHLTSDQYKLGKYNKIAKMFILKREVINFWGVYNELFGIPFRVLKTNVLDDIQKENGENAMKQMTSAAFSVIGLDDEIEFINSAGSSGSGYETFSSFIDFANKEMSKALLGSTMVLDDGSSKSQSEVHLENTKAFINSRAKWAMNVVNDELIPRMISLGFPLVEGDKFMWKEESKLTHLEWAEVVSKLSNSFEIPVDFIKETFGIDVEEKQLDVSITDVEPENKSRSNKILNFYKKIFE